MRIDITIPNPIFEATTKLAQKLDMSLSELYTVALVAYVTAYETGNKDITTQLNELYELEASAIEPKFVAVQLVSIGGDDW